MSEEIEVVERSLGVALEIEERCSVFKLPKLLGKHYGTITAFTKEAGVETVDMPYARYLGIDWDKEARRSVLSMIKLMLFEKMHFTAGRFVNSPTAGKGPVQAYDFGTQRYLRTFHIGPYMKVGKAYKRLMAHASDGGLALADHSIEHYIDDPTKVDKTNLRTDVMIPLR